MVLKRIQDNLCNEHCVSWCICAEKHIYARIGELVRAKGGNLRTARSDDGIFINVFTRHTTSVFHIVFVRDHLRVRHEVQCEKDHTRTQQELIFSNYQEALDYVAANL